MIEKWKKIKDISELNNKTNIHRLYEYEISTFGNVRHIITKERLIPFIANGYYCIKCYNLTIHRLVAYAFIPNPNNYNEINHIDENKLNNNIENLEWCTRSMNMRHGSRGKKFAKTYKQNHPISPTLGRKIPAISAALKGKPKSEEHKRKISESEKGKIISEETRQKLSKSLKGKKRPPRSKEWCEKLSIAHKGKKLSEEHKRKISESGKGRKHSEETRQKMRDARKRKSNNEN